MLDSETLQKISEVIKRLGYPRRAAIVRNRRCGQEIIEDVESAGFYLYNPIRLGKA